jgi:hypothetical protein
MCEANPVLGPLEGLADFHILLEKHPIELICEGDDCVVLDLLRLGDADDMLGAGLLEDLADELRVTGSYYHELQFAFVLNDHLLEGLPTDQVAVSVLCLKEQQVALAFVDAR